MKPKDIKSTGRPITRELSDFIVNTKFEHLPKELVEQAKLCILDIIGTTIRGSKTSSAQLVANYVKNQGGTPQSSVIQQGFLTTAFNAAYVNGTTASSIELDDGHILAHSHPGAIVVPAALAIGERDGLPGRDVIVSTVLGYDLNIRLGQAINGPEKGALYARSFSSSAVTGSFSSAAVCAKLLGLNSSQVANALGIAALGPAATSGGVSQLGAAVKNSFQGWPSAVGIMAAELAAMGYTGDTTVFEGTMGFCQAVSDDYSLDILNKDLGTKWNIMDIYRKRHAMCSHGHPILDGVLEILEDGIDYKDIQKVEIRSYKFTSLMNANRPLTVQQGMFSVPYSVATVLVKRRPLLIDDFEPQFFNNKTVLGLADRVSIEWDPDIDNYHQTHHDERPSQIQFTLTDGRVLTSRVTSAKGWPDKPMTTEEVKDKFRLLVKNILGEQITEEVIYAVDSLEDIGNIKKLLSYVI